MMRVIWVVWAYWVGAWAAFAVPIYSADFQGEVGREWSSRTVQQTPVGKRKFLGKFSNQVVRLKLNDLADHKLIRLRFDLLIIGPWGGDVFAGPNNMIIGPDQWGLDVGQRVLIHTTFSNQHFRKTAKQAYPGSWGQFSTAAGTGAAAKDTLGYKWNYKDSGRRKADSLYSIEVVFPHTSTELLLNFYGMCLDKHSESWGLDNVTVEALARSPFGKTDRKTLMRQYQALLDKDPAKSLRARWALACAGDDALVLLEKLLVREQERQQHALRIAALVKQLGSPEYKKRRAASEALSRLGALAAPQLQAALKAGPLHEVRWRLEALLDRLRRAKLRPNAKQRKRQRVLAVLAIIGGEQATRLITRVTGSPYGAAALVAGSHWKGLCLQNGHPSYFMGYEITKRQGNQLWGKIHWPATNNSKTLWRGRIVGNRVIFQEYELIQGSGIIVPCDYETRIVGQLLIGPWMGASQIGGVQLRLAADSTGSDR